MNRQDFRNRAESISTKKGYDKAFKKLDSFYEVRRINETQFFKMLEENKAGYKYELLQSLIDFIKTTVSPRVARGYFESLFMYFVLCDLPLDYGQKRIRLKMPRVSQRRFEGLDKNKIESLMRLEESARHRSYYSLLYGGGLRETEGLRVTPSMFEFSNITRLKLPAEITKFNIERETMIAETPANRIKEFIEINDFRNDDLIFLDKWNDETDLIPFEKHFARLRTKAGLDTINRKKHQQNDITLHSFRSFFITTLTDHDLESFAHALTGHSKYMDTYYRKSIDKRIETFGTVAEFVNF
jgi:integrase